MNSVFVSAIGKQITPVCHGAHLYQSCTSLYILFYFVRYLTCKSSNKNSLRRAHEPFVFLQCEPKFTIWLSLSERYEESKINCLTKHIFKYTRYNTIGNAT